jgi:hypothetical protein
MAMLRKIAFGLLLLTSTACTNVAVLGDTAEPTNGPEVMTADDVTAEISRCEATGQSEKDCYDSHFLTPPPPPVVTITPADVVAAAAVTLHEANHLAREQHHTKG